MPLPYSDVVLDPKQLEPERIRPLRRVEYDRLVELGVFDEDERIALVAFPDLALATDDFLPPTE